MRAVAARPGPTSVGAAGPSPRLPCLSRRRCARRSPLPPDRCRGAAVSSFAPFSRAAPGVESRPAPCSSLWRSAPAAAQERPARAHLRRGPGAAVGLPVSHVCRAGSGRDQRPALVARQSHPCGQHDRRGGAGGIRPRADAGVRVQPSRRRAEFRKAAAADPKLAMAWWGVALVNGPHINNAAMTDEPAKSAWDAVGKARRLRRRHAGRARAARGGGGSLCAAAGQDRRPLDEA